MGMTYKFFSTPTCGVCKTMWPVVQTMCPEIQYVSLRSNDFLTVLHDLTTVPTIIAEEDGKEVKRISGGRSKAELVEFFK